jgi:diguanylate cyclase (GGDEF)-like protein
MNATTDPLPGSTADLAARGAARGRIFQLLRVSQTGGELTAKMVDELVADAESRDWPDVVTLGLYLAVFCARFVDREPGLAEIAALYDRAVADDDDVMVALALACRAQGCRGDDGRAPIDIDRDLAQAMVLLERFQTPSAMVVLAHIECAYACEERDLWELQLRHYEMAEPCLDWEEHGEQYLQVLLCNRAEAELFWLVALREGGQFGELAARAQAARRAIAATETCPLPPAWRDAVCVFGDLVDAILPAADGTEPAAPEAEGQFAGYVHLARAFRTVDAEQARAHCDLALETIDPAASGRVQLLALALAAELEAAQADRETAGLRWGRELARRRHQRRLASLASIESLVAVGRRANEHALLEKHAYLDDLTGLANRRGLTRAVEAMRADGVSTVAVALFDLDEFKVVNDRHGHAAGDAVLVRAACILDAGVRAGDLVVRLGGDEFLVLLAVSEYETAHRRAEALVHAMRTSNWDEVAEGLTVTTSAGVALGSAECFDALCAEADSALYRAKKAGRARLAV